MATNSSFRLKGKARDSYLACVMEFPLTTISSNAHLEAAQEVMDGLLTKGKPDRGEQPHLDALSDLVASYEDEHFPIAPASDADSSGTCWKPRGFRRRTCIEKTRISKSSISEVLSGKKPFSRQMIRKLADYFDVDVNVLAANL